MLLALDVGNTEIVVGLFADGSNELVDHWRLSCDPERTSDELALVLAQLLALRGVRLTDDLSGVAMCSGVPKVATAIRALAARYLGVAPVVIEPGTRTGVPVLYENPREVGADRIANAVGALDRFEPPIVVVDFGTATTLDAISARGEYLGGAIVPGVVVALDALYERAALLRRVELVEPRHAIGRSTEQSIQSGALFGTAALVDGMVERMAAELDDPTVVATGGLSALVGPYCRRIEHHEPLLTLHGLRVVFERNRG